MAPIDGISSLFGLEEHDTDLRTEIVAGLTTFLTMSYIVVVNPQIMGQVIDVGTRSDAQIVQMLTVVTILSAAVATFVMGVYANRPFALAPGLGLNAFFAFTVVGTLGVPWRTALAAIVVEGVIFGVLTLIGARKYVIELFPKPVKLAVGAGIGLYLAIIGLQAMRVTAGDASTFVSLNPVFATDPVAIISVVGLFVTFALHARGIRGSIVLGVLGTTVMSYLAAALGYNAVPAKNAPQGTTLSSDAVLDPISVSTLSSDPLSAFSYTSGGYDITPLIGAFLEGLADIDSLAFALIVFTFFFVDFFDTAGTLTGVSQAAGFLDEDGNVPEIDKPLLADAIGTTVGGILGTSTVTTYIESATGVEEGGRTGLTAVVVAGLFLASLAIVPLASAIPMHASHIALVVVAVLMLRGIVDIQWDDFTHAVPAALTLLVMPFTFSIAYGIAAGIIAYPVVKAAGGEWADVRPGQMALLMVFVLYFYVRTSGLLTHLI
ncbi:NCS2 family permease [Halocatena salina]|uniref:NCS2 family permease n=1 Tax=Halocatena salina TaxID=2934340 RepID=A0A8U0A298_9EURY|nr:NCS2 family permease [Halocatena salina]UPM42117.1 NCS2 family permease [Halocatena salina]